MRRAKIFLALGFVGLVLLGPGTVFGIEVVTLDTRPGVTQSFLLLEPEGTAKGVVIALPGHEGEVEFRVTPKKGFTIINYGGQGGGLTISPPMRELLRKGGFAVAIIAPPSDRKLLSPLFRVSTEHLADMRVVIAHLSKRYGAKVYLQGHCLSTLSAASVASLLKSEGLSGLILSSTRSTGKDGSVTDFERGTVTVPVLLVHHRDDSCSFAPYKNVEGLGAFYRSSAPRVDTITVTGGEVYLRANKNRCKDGAHGFKGMERETAQAIVNWLRGEDFPAQIDGAKS